MGKFGKKIFFEGSDGLLFLDERFFLLIFLNLLGCQFNCVRFFGKRGNELNWFFNFLLCGCCFFDLSVDFILREGLEFHMWSDFGFFFWEILDIYFRCFFFVFILVLLLLNKKEFDVDLLNLLYYYVYYVRWRDLLYLYKYNLFFVSVI